MDLSDEEKALVAGWLRDEMSLCRIMRDVKNGEDYDATLRYCHSIAAKAGIDPMELESD